MRTDDKMATRQRTGRCRAWDSREPGLKAVSNIAVQYVQPWCGQAHPTKRSIPGGTHDMCATAGQFRHRCRAFSPASSKSARPFLTAGPFPSRLASSVGVASKKSRQIAQYGLKGKNQTVRSDRKPTNQPTSQPANQPSNQQANQPTKQTDIQASKQPTKQTDIQASKQDKSASASDGHGRQVKVGHVARRVMSHAYGA